MRTVAAILASIMAASPAVAAAAQAQTTGQTQTPPQTQGGTQTTTQPKIPVTPESFERIRAAVNRPAKLRIENGQLRIYVEVIANWPTFKEFSKGYDFIHGPTGGGNPMSHSEFLGMVTPQEMYGSGGIQAGELLVIGLVNYFGQKYVKKGIKAIGEAKDAKEIAEIRAQIDRELALLKNGGGGG